MKENGDQAHIHYILSTSEKLLGLVKEENARKAYQDDWIRQGATLRGLHTLSESASKLSGEAKTAMPNIEWEEIHAFRNALVHGYLGNINHDAVWLVLENKLPDLRNTLLAYYEEHYGEYKQT